MIIPIGAKIAFHKVQHILTIKTLSKLEKGNFLNLIKIIYQKPTATSYLIVRE